MQPYLPLAVLFSSALSLATYAGAQSLAPGLGVLPQSISGAPDDAWVPVMLLTEQSAGSKPPVLLGLAQVKDIEDGYPYKVGLYQLTGDVKLLGGLSAQMSAGKMTLTPVCSTGSAPRCEPLVGVVGAARSNDHVAVNARYQLGPVQLNAGAFHADRAYTQMLNPYLPFPSSPTLTLLNGSGKQIGVNLTGTIGSGAGTFGMGLALAKTPISLLPTPQSYPLRNAQLNEGNLNLNWIGGAFGTQLSTRILELSGSNRVWGGIDLGLTWRTPWQGTLTFGAKNLVVSGKPPAYLDPESAADAVEQDRVPYVRYEQDL
jgi:hypothetical protein